MEVHRQTCQDCGSIDVRNILVREEGRAQMVFVRCAKCGDLVARYRLRDYYHHGKDVESFLRSHGAEASDSGRSHLDEFGRIQDEAQEGYEQALNYLREKGKEI